MLLPSSGLKCKPSKESAHEASGCFKMPVDFQQTTQCYIQEDKTLFRGTFAETFEPFITSD
jgi:hypothetical protein